MATSARAIDIIRRAATAASGKLASDPVAFDVSDRLAITDAFLIVTAANDRQVNAVVEAIEEALAAEGIRPVRREGEREQRWVLLDYLDAVIHVQQPEERTTYALERLWKDCPVIDLGEAVAAG